MGQKHMVEHASWIYPSEDIGEVCPVFRKHFTARPGAAAKLEITAFGVYEAFLNGQRIGNFFLAPGWTSYPTRLQVQTYDLTALRSVAFRRLHQQFRFRACLNPLYST